MFFHHALRTGGDARSHVRVRLVRREGTKAKGCPDVTPVDALAGLSHKGESLRRVGTATVRGTPTVHYSVVGAKPPVDLWVDAHDRLRRLVWTHADDKQTDTTELYDFGAPVTITPPPHAQPCSPIPPGLAGPGNHCILGRSIATLPKCKPATR
jgi:hypothetical protein